jgi:hypothetical protein
LEGQEYSRGSSSLDDEMVGNQSQGSAKTNHFRGFVRTEVLKACAWYLLFDLCFYPINLSRYTTASPPDFFSDSLLRQAFLAVMIGIPNYCTLNLQYSLGCALIVALGLCTPQDCPPLMGRLREVSTVRNFWGRFWRKYYLLGGYSLCC